MTRVIVDAATRDKLRNNSDGIVEVCDEAGQVLGLFHETPPIPPHGGWHSPFTREEIQRRREEKGGRTLAEILKDLGAE